jgi:hypothetical protein
MKVFRKGKFYEYDESFGDSSWSYDQILQASSFYATCIYLGYNEELSYSLSFMYISTLYMPGLKYPDEYMNKIENIINKIELSIVREKH